MKRFIGINRILSRITILEKAAVFGLYLVISLVYYSDILYSWFFLDDALAIVCSGEGMKKIFFVNNYSHFFYTPLLPLSFKPDVSFFGLNPFPYHIHNLIILVLTAFMTYLILRRYTGRVSSFVAAGMVLLSAPSLVCTTWITLRQYIYPMFFSLAAVYLYLKYSPDLKNNRLIVLVILFLAELSFMGKEQYVTLPFVLFILTEGGLKKRLVKTFPYFILLICHILLRQYVLGSLGGYLGMQFGLKVYAKTAASSFPVAARVIFGYSWVIILIALPFFLKPAKLAVSILLWLAALSISLLVMADYPSAESYRYWFIAVVLMSIGAGLGSSLIRDDILRATYLLIITVLFLSHSLQINKDLKNFFQKKAAAAKQISEFLIDGRYANSIVLFPEDIYLTAGDYLSNMSLAFSWISAAETYPSFYPIELLAFYPSVLSNVKGVYSAENSGIVEIADPLDGEIEKFKSALGREKPELKLYDTGGKTMLHIKCKAAKKIAAYLIEKKRTLYNGRRIKLPYLEKINIRLLIKGNKVELFPIEALSYHDGGWYIGERQIDDKAKVITGACIDEGGKSTGLSDILYIDNPKGERLF